MTASLAPTIISTEEYALAASQGDVEALRALCDRFYDPVLRYLLTRTQHNMTIAEDAAQHTWERVVKAIRGYRRQRSGFEAWLFTIARRCLCEHYRRTSRRRERLDGEMLAMDTADGTEGPAELLDRKFASHRVAGEVQALAPAQRRCLTLRFFVGLSVSETASVMGKSEGAVKQLQLRGLETLQRRLSDLGRVESPTDAVYVADSTAMARGGQPR